MIVDRKFNTMNLLIFPKFNLRMNVIIPPRIKPQRFVYTHTHLCVYYVCVRLHKLIVKLKWLANDQEHPHSGSSVWPLRGSKILPSACLRPHLLVQGPHFCNSIGNFKEHPDGSAWHLWGFTVQQIFCATPVDVLWWFSESSNVKHNFK